MPEATTVFAIQLKAVAGPDCDRETGEACALIAFAQGETMDMACERVDSELDALGWQEIEFSKGAPIAPIRSHADWRFVDAYQAAEGGGVGLLVWVEGQPGKGNTLAH